MSPLDQSVNISHAKRKTTATTRATKAVPRPPDCKCKGAAPLPGIEEVAEAVGETVALLLVVIPELRLDPVLELAFPMVPVLVGIVKVVEMAEVEFPTEVDELEAPPSLPPEETVDVVTVSLAVVVDESVFVTVALPLVDVADVEEEVDVDEDEEEDEGPVPASSQLRSYRGVVVSSLPIRPKLGLGMSGAASWRVYHL